MVADRTGAIERFIARTVDFSAGLVPKLTEPTRNLTRWNWGSGSQCDLCHFEHGAGTGLSRERQVSAKDLPLNLALSAMHAIRCTVLADHPLRICSL